MDDNELGKREKEVNCVPSYQCPPGEKGFYTLASNKNETILKLKQEESGNTNNRNRANKDSNKHVSLFFERFLQW